MDGPALPKGFTEESVARLLSDLQADPDVGGVLPVLSESVAVTNPATRQFESRAELAGLDPQLAPGFDQLYDTSGAPSTWPDWGRTRSTSPGRPPSPSRPRPGTPYWLCWAPANLSP